MSRLLLATPLLFMPTLVLSNCVAPHAPVTQSAHLSERDSSPRSRPDTPKSSGAPTEDDGSAPW